MKHAASRTEHRDLYSGLIRLHILDHAAHEPILGLGMIEAFDTTSQSDAAFRFGLRIT